jgi:hypothetical protein
MWLFVLILFTAREGAAILGCLGFGLATSVTVGALIIRGVWVDNIRKSWAVLLVALSSALSAVAPPVLMLRLCDLSGDAGMWVLVMPVMSTAAGALAFLITTLCILLVRKTTVPN